MIGWNPNGIPTRSMENMRWYSPSQALIAKQVLYPQLTATAIYTQWFLAYIRIQTQVQNNERLFSSFKDSL